MIPEIHIEEYSYQLPDERIAKYPLSQRDASKLLCYKDGAVTENRFSDIADILPANHLMVFNDTKVVPARLHFQRATGAHIEIFCLEPVLPEEYVSMFAVTDSCRWKCIVGNVKRWKDDVLTLYNPDADADVTAMGLQARLVERQGETSIVEFFWADGSPFSRVLEVCGNIPIPPYLNRGTEDIDLERYQTLYARYRGSVAAPTAGLHFTDAVMDKIRARNIDIQTVCLHVGAGTFLPVKSSLVSEHTMHREPFVIKAEFLRKLRDSIGKVIAVGTTSVRTLESLYYIGVAIAEARAKGVAIDSDYLHVEQWTPYDTNPTLSASDSLQAILDYLDREGKESLVTSTQIIIAPSYQFKIVRGIITNFHQPQSTLLLLVSALVGDDWHKIYKYAFDNGFRFLSYGDSSLLLP